jgi:uncharacterized protein (DUF779 family)
MKIMTDNTDNTTKHAGILMFLKKTLASCCDSNHPMGFPEASLSMKVSFFVCRWVQAASVMRVAV